MNGEGMIPITLTAPAANAGTTDFGDAVKTPEKSFPRLAMRLVQGTGSEAIKGDSDIEIGGALTWIVRVDDELNGYDIDATDPANPQLVKARPPINASWSLTDEETGEKFQIFSVTQTKVRGGERRFRIHTKSDSLNQT